MTLDKPNLTYSFSENRSEYRDELSTDILAKDVYLSSPLSGNFSENYFDLLPNLSKIVTIPKSADSTLEKFKEQLKILTLDSSY